MGKIVVSEFISLDGVVEAPETWHSPYISDDMQAETNRQIHESDALLLGRVTYEDFAGFWPTQTQNEFGIADKLNSTPKFVVSSTLETADWNNSTLIKANVFDEIRRLKQEIGGTIAVTGSPTLVQSLAQADLIDEYRLMVHPVVAGSGKHLFSDGIGKTPLKRVDCRTFSSGVVLLCYQPDREA